jgi:hypothetical protein
VLGVDVQRLNHHLVDAGVGFSEADLGRLVNVIKKCYHFIGIERPAALAADAAGGKVVGDAAGLELWPP